MFTVTHFERSGRPADSESYRVVNELRPGSSIKAIVNVYRYAETAQPPLEPGAIYQTYCGCRMDECVHQKAVLDFLNKPPKKQFVTF